MDIESWVSQIIEWDSELPLQEQISVEATYHLAKRLFQLNNAAQQSVKLTAFGADMLALIGKYLVRWGCRLARIGGA